MADYPIGRSIVGEDKSGALRSAHVHRRDGHVGLNVFSSQQNIYNPRPLFFANDENGIAMNINAAFGGSPIIVCNGSEVTPADWVFSEPVGTKAVDENTDQKNSGSRSVLWDNGSLNDIVQFADSGPLTISSYVALTLAIYVDKDWSVNDEISVYGYDTGVPGIVGNSVDLSDYFNAQDFDKWHILTIPFADLGLSAGTLDAVRFQITDRSVKSPKLYIDDVKFETAGTVATYSVMKDPAKDYYVNAIRFSFADAFTGTITGLGDGTEDSTMIGLAYDQILGDAALTNGITFQRVQDGEVSFSANLKQLSDFLRIGSGISNVISDGANTFLTLEVKFFEPIILRGSPSQNYLSLTVADDMSTLLLFNAIARGVDKEN